MNENINKYIEYLSFLHLQQNQENWSQNFIACNTKSHMPAVNRVYVPNQLDKNDFKDLELFFGEFDFTLWLNQSNEYGNEIVTRKGCSPRCSYPLMHADLSKPISHLENSSIKVSQLLTQQEILSIWAPLVVSAYGKIDLTQFQKFISYLLSTTQKNKIHFYIGYYLNQPCATSMFILRDDNIADIHWVGTLPEFRNKGLGSAVTCYPLNKLKNELSEAILYSSEMGRPIYEKIGFREICKVNVYNSLNFLSI